jgi:hypothetical protein
MNCGRKLYWMKYGGNDMGKVKIICVNGVSRSGKDTFVDYLAEIAPLVVKHSTIDTVRKALIESKMLDYRKKGEKEREFLATVKQAWIKYDDGPFKEVLTEVAVLEKEYKYMSHVKEILFIVQVREIEEIQKLKNHFQDSFYSVLVVRDSVKFQHKTDKQVEDWNYDFMAVNNGLKEDLKKQAISFLFS